MSKKNTGKKNAKNLHPSLGASYAQSYSGGTGSRYDFSSFPPGQTDYDFASISYDPIIKIGVTQPLLYNWFSYLDRYEIQDAKNKLKIEQLKQDLNRNTLLNYYQKLYFLWLEYRNMLQNLNQSLVNTQTLEKKTRDKMEMGLRENDDLQRSRYAVIKYQEQIQSIQYELEKIDNTLSFILDVNTAAPDLKDFIFWIRILNIFPIIFDAIDPASFSFYIDFSMVF